MADLHRVCVVGSGNFGSTLAKVIAENVVNLEGFDPIVRMWVLEEKIDGQNLTDIINTKHENVRYLSGIKLPENVLAIPDLAEASKGCDFFLVVIPHQFLLATLPKIPKVREGSTAISAIKGVNIVGTTIELMSDTIEHALGVPCGGLMGANIAIDVAREAFTETTIAFRDKKNGDRWLPVLNRPYFKCSVIGDLCFQQLCGTLKNVLSLTAGFVHGLGYGESTKGSLLRIGMIEMYEFARWAFPDENVQLLTLLESCGVGDLIASAFGGRNSRCAEEFVRSGRSWDVIEKELLNGQKLQGTESAESCFRLIKSKGAVRKFPLLSTTALVAEKKVPPRTIVAFDGPHLDLA